jgi:hypothetical protein
VGGRACDGGDEVRDFGMEALERVSGPRTKAKLAQGSHYHS